MTKNFHSPTTPQEALQSNLKQPLKQKTPQEALHSELEAASSSKEQTKQACQFIVKQKSLIYSTHHKYWLTPCQLWCFNPREIGPMASWTGIFLKYLNNRRAIVFFNQKDKELFFIFLIFISNIIHGFKEIFDRPQLLAHLREI
jgi:hypothetical protein